ncbi:Patatin-like phospholipase domain-containing protein 2 [Bagarius yarrelli]|uniref:triacylglycerol lipase n=1 Tax=Bagarius yarrelli TaxID=175774 RepID=A0A556THN5_BAGYA|nr:Patatin-like phospholipase domain-containing protein 2 [Bagarius yarrelli]
MDQRKNTKTRSFTGGMTGIYHLGVSSCLLDRAPFLIHRANKIYGASAGALNAAVLTSGLCIEKCCGNVIEVAKEARKRNLGPLHPTFNLVKVLRLGLQRDLPENAHTLVSGKLCVSLTRVSDGENVLVSDFSSKDELIQALICSSFIPVFCGLFPPAFRGVRYVDGGMSNNLPQSDLKNTISISPFSGESDICPKDNSSSLHELRFTNTSIQVNWGNACRLSKVFFPPEPKVMAELCQQGYKDTLRFLEDNKLLQAECPKVDLSLTADTPTCCCGTETTRERMLRRLHLLGEHHWWLDEQLVNHLPTPIKKVFCDACKEKHGLMAQITGLFPVRVASFMLMPYTLPVESAYSAVQRFVEWIPEVPADARWLFEIAGSVYRQAWKGESSNNEFSLRRCVSGPPSLNLQPCDMEHKRHVAFSAADLHEYSWNYSEIQEDHENFPSPEEIGMFVGSQDNSESSVQQEVDTH